ncbi:MAG TPA: SUF system NifU family Fe-S cluster assembly protein [Vicinamibacteria bacterium]|nr:SUF system NifU family Fe-S cluster assembly protein [Vicinamibacteria bacterium]
MSGDELRELYQEVILDHSKRPRNFREMEHPTHRAVGHNPLCGDRATIYVEVEDGVVRDVSFHGAGCSISTASASMMTDAVRGKTVEQALLLFQRFHQLVTADPGRAAEVAPELGKLAVFAGVHEFPVRVKCASLAWHTLKAALEGGAGATTE